MDSFVSDTGSIRAEISLVGRDNFTIRKDIWVGKPDVNNIKLICHSHSLIPPIEVELNSTHSYYASLYDNSLEDYGDFKWQVWGGTANHSTGPYNVITYDLLGNALLEIYRQNTCGESLRKSFNILVSRDGGNPGGGDPIGLLKLNVKPNPVNEYFEVEIEDETFEQNGNDCVTYRLFNDRSVPVFTGNTNKKTFRVNTLDLHNGLYMLQFIYKGKKCIKQIIIEH